MRLSCRLNYRPDEGAMDIALRWPSARLAEAGDAVVTPIPPLVWGALAAAIAGAYALVRSR